MLGFDTIPMATTLTGMFWSTSTSSGVLKQATTQVELRGSVGGLTNTNALASGGDLSGDGALGVLGGGLNGVVLVVQRTLLFARVTVVGWGTFPVAITGQEGCNIVFHPV